MSDDEKPRRYQVCHGRGYTRCACWPGDCICGQEDEDCLACDGAGWYYPEDDDFLERD